MTRIQRAIAVVVTWALLEGAIWIAMTRAYITPSQSDTAMLAISVSWLVMTIVVLALSGKIDALRDDLEARQDLHRATLDQVEQIGTLNDMLLTMGRSKEVGLTFQGLARRIGRLVPCDRLGLALLKSNGLELQTFSARVSEPERRRRPRPEVEYNIDRSVFGQVIRTCEPALIDDLSQHASEFQDATTMASQGFKSALVLPLISRNRAIGALTIASRRLAAFSAAQRDALQPLAEVLAVAAVVQQQLEALDKFRAAESVAEMSLALSTDISSALQAIMGHSGLIARAHPAAAADAELISQQAERIADLMDRIRTSATDQLREAALAMPAGVPSSPEAFSDEEASL